MRAFHGRRIYATTIRTHIGHSTDWELCNSVRVDCVSPRCVCPRICSVVGTVDASEVKMKCKCGARIVAWASDVAAPNIQAATSPALRIAHAKKRLGTVLVLRHSSFDG